MPHGLAVGLRWTGRVLGALAVVVFLGLAAERGVPRSYELAQWEKPAQYFALGFATAGYLLAWRFEGIGGVLMATAGVAMGILASLEFHPTESVFTALAFFVPGLLFLLIWQRTQTVHAMAVLAAVMVILLGAGYYTSDRIYSYYFGPAHAESPLRAQPVDIVDWIWAGGTTPTSVSIRARLDENSEHVRLALSKSQDMSGAVYSGEMVADKHENRRVLAFTFDGLKPDTRYYYAVEADGHMDTSRQGTLRTALQGPGTFSFAFASCARSGSNGAVYDAIRESDPLFFLAIGDWFYGDIATNNPDLYRAAYQDTLTRPAQAALYRSTSTGYVWDDHDYGGNNADRDSPSREAATTVYRELVPHYPLPAGEGNAAIYQAFTAGRVRFIMTDTRSERTAASAPDGPEKSMLGSQQKEWLKSELLAARDRYALIVWVNPDPWIDLASAGADTWGGYDTERRELADFIADNGIRNILMLSGDAHMLAIDDSTHSDYSAKGGAAFPVFHAAALDRPGHVKGGPYSEGAYPGAGQFGLVTIDDSGGPEVKVSLSGRNWTSEEIVSYEFTVSGRAATAASVR